MKVALIGAHGQLGKAIRRSVPNGIECHAYTRLDLDVRDEAQIAKRLTDLRPDVVINAAAYTAVDKAETDSEAAFALNSTAAGYVAETLTATGGRLVHISTDFVFSGERASPYRWDDAPKPVNVYGESKLAGERAVVKALGSQAVVLRTSWLYSGHGTNFVRTMLAAMRSRDSLSVVYDQIGTPTWTRSAARTVWTIVTRPEISGIHHWSDEGLASWYDFAVAIQEEALARKMLPRAIPIRAIRTRDYPTPARRPAYSVLDKQETVASTGLEAIHWRANLRAMLDELSTDGAS